MRATRPLGVPLRPLVATLLVAAVVAACSGAAATPSPPPPLTVDRASAGTTVTLAPGQSLVVSLDSNPSTGFSWLVGEAPDPAILAQAGAPAFSPGTETGALGAGGTEVFTFVATGIGETGFTLAYRRSFEGGATDQFQLGVTVR